jgi:hypothetical protein
MTSLLLPSKLAPSRPRTVVAAGLIKNNRSPDDPQQNAIKGDPRRRGFWRQRLIFARMATFSSSTRWVIGAISKGPWDVVFCSDMVPFAPHLLRSSHLPESSIMGRERRALRST